MVEGGVVGPKLFGLFEFNSVSVAGRRNVREIDCLLGTVRSVETWMCCRSY